MKEKIKNRLYCNTIHLIKITSIMKRNKEDELALHEYKGYRYYKENP